MSFLIKQAINSLASETSDIQVVLNQKADASQIYTKFDTYSTTDCLLYTSDAADE